MAMPAGFFEVETDSEPAPGTTCIRPTCEHPPWAKVRIRGRKGKENLEFWVCLLDSRDLQRDLPSIIEYLEGPEPVTEEPQRLSNRQKALELFAFRATTEEGVLKHEKLNQDLQEFYLNAIVDMPESREKSLVITKLEELAMWAHRALSLQDPIVPPAPETML